MRIIPTDQQDIMLAALRESGTPEADVEHARTVLLGAREDAWAGVCTFRIGGLELIGPVPKRAQMRSWRKLHEEFLQKTGMRASEQFTPESFRQQFFGLMALTDQVAELVHAFADWIPPEPELSELATDTEYLAVLKQMVAIANPSLAAAASIRGLAAAAQGAAAQVQREAPTATD